jgi:hypothetical protein
MSRCQVLLLCGSLSLTHVSSLFAQNEEALQVVFGAFVDAYYAYDFERPLTRDRAYTTQPARHNEFNLNLAFIEAKISGARVRGRFALQTGTSVHLNYSAETKNRELAQLIHEGVIGYRLAGNLWVDAGIYLSHLGLESWISRDNRTYTRSLCSDFSPYYQSGVKATWQASRKFALQLHVLNGWQNIAETNNDKALGLQAAFTPSEKFSLTYNNFFGNEQNDSLAARTRFFNDVVLKFSLSKSFQIAGMIDYGLEEKPAGSGNFTWYDVMLVGRLRATPTFALTGRFEYYADKDQVLVKTGTPEGFQIYGASITTDVAVAPSLLWRFEGRLLSSKDEIYPTNDSAKLSGRNVLLAASLALTL